MRYFLITYVRKPNGQIDEMVTISKRTRTSDIQTCNVILDFQSKKIDKCVIEGKVVDSDWGKMCEYYKRVYPTLIDQLEKANSNATKV
jgi:hypothetical protein